MDVVKLKEEHEKKGGKYPRPTLKCPECDGILILCWGKKVDPYVRHKVKTDVEHKSGGESWNHAFAKRLLCEFLNDGGKCLFNHHCNSVQESIASKLIYEEEVSINGGKTKLDIGGTNVEGRVVLCIEIKHTHKTSNTEDRDNLTWFEVEANEVLRKLHVDKTPTEITLNNIRELPCCRSKVLTLEVKQYYAQKLGCFNRTDTNRTYIIHQVAVRNDRKCATFIEEWLLPSYDEQNKPPFAIWNEFIKHQQCLCCEIEWKTSMFKPYCTRCYSYVIEGCVAMDILEISKEMQGILRGELVWLCSLPNASKPGLPCHFCRKTARTQGVPANVWWFGDMKRLCWECFDQKLDKDGIYNIKLQ